MTVIESKVTINAPAASVYNFLADLNNHHQLMPENVVGWTATKDEARFNIQNMAKLVLQVSNRNPNEILINAVEAPPFPLELKWQIKEAGTQTQVFYTISADMNMMMKMLASGQLQKLADFETQRLKELVTK
ncbi:SRPBCC family protein [Mucilaginibacter arboris]|uniref:SRPBCC family protein n=1 Tax=Mucilaginibacter arboris TaxID=2682090 RepID=A0A7K1T0U3_9SPHI|nr:SRPBCC family protein [Mucilaginibacter arboris]MVN23184.1 SRPBCC family protein [Mucilaginibacter arboris]